MKIKYVHGDLFKTEICDIAHGCNSKGVMGSGVAKIIRDRFPEAHMKYVDHYNKFGLHMGENIVAPSRGKIIHNLITQDSYGRSGNVYVDYHAIREAMKNLNFSAKVNVAMPQIGAGLGGGDWKKISKIIEEELVDVQPYVYVLDKALIPDDA